MTHVTPTTGDRVNGLVRLRGQNLKEFSAQIGVGYQRVKNVLHGQDTSPVVREKIERGLGEIFWPKPKEVA